MRRVTLFEGLQVGAVYVGLINSMLLLAGALVCYAPDSAYGFISYPVGEAIHGEAYSETTKTWNKRELSLRVGIDSSGEEFVLFSAESSSGDADVWIPYAKGEVAQIEKLLVTAREWVNIARTNRVDTSKVLGCFPDAQYLICERDGVPHGPKQIGIRFYAVSEGQTSAVIFDMMDERHEYKRATIHFGPTEIEQLLIALRHVEHSFWKTREMAQKQNLFKTP